MPAQTFKCFICSEEVSKPKSYSVARLGLGREGRACRCHSVVKEAEQSLQDEALSQAGLRALQLRILVEKIRVEEMVRGMKYPHFCYQALQERYRLNNQEIQEIRDRVESAGPISATEAMSSLAIFAAAQRAST